jgi:hypothetical protein
MSGHCTRKNHDLEKRVFGKLTVVRFHGPMGKLNRPAWWRRCECGNEKPVNQGNLISGKTKSCGCARDEMSRQRATKHGLVGIPEYEVWKSMIQRTTNSNNAAAGNYVHRGISVSDSWRDSFRAFIEDMGRRPSKKHSIERTNNDLGYSKENCVWATRAEQSRNSRRNRLITFNGRTMVSADWAKEIGIQQSTLMYRLRNWPLERAMTERSNASSG